MAKRTQKRHLRDVKDQSGCMWGLVRMFGLHHDRYTKKMISNQKWKRQSKGVECSRNEFMPSDFRRDLEGVKETTTSINNGETTSVKKLMEEEMFNHLVLQKPKNASQEAREKSCSRNKNRKAVDDDNDINEFDLSRSLPSEETCFRNPQLVLQELGQILEKGCNGVLNLKNIYDLQSDQTLKIDKERLSMFINLLIDRFRDDDGQFLQSSVFMEVLQRFGSQRDLFLKLLQDPNFLMINRIECLEETIVEKDPSFINKKPRKFFTRWSKSKESLHSSPGKNEKCQISNKIVILKPGSSPAVSLGYSIQSRNPTVSKIEGEKRHFSFSEIKRRLKHAIGKEKQIVSTGKQVQCDGESIEWCFSPNRNHFFNERYIRLNRTKPFTALSDKPEPRVSDIYIKAKKNISDIIENEGNNAQKITGELPNPLSMVLSLPEYDFSYSNDSQTVNKSSDRIDEEEIECHPNPPMPHSRSSSYENLELLKVVESILGNHDQGNVETREIVDQMCEEENASAEVEGCVLHYGDNEIFSSPKVENPEGFNDKTERPSPVSVLEHSFSEDDIISPAKTLSWPVDMKIQPREIVFSDERPTDDQVLCVRISSEDNETAFEYVEAVLLGSDLNWDEYLSRLLSSSTVLDSSLYDEVELFSSKPQHEQRMLFDCTNEVLEEVCERYFGSFCGNSCTRRDLLAVPKGMDLILAIWEGVTWHLHRYPQSQSLDQLIKKDMARTRAWMGLRLDTEHIVTDIENSILENIVQNLVWSFIYGVSESKFVTFSEGLTEIESTIIDVDHNLLK